MLSFSELTQTPRIEGWGKKKSVEIDRNPLLCPILILYYDLNSEQILAQQASWYTENPATTLLLHLLPQHGANHAYFARIWEQTLPWSNQKRKTNLFTTCWEILTTTTMDGLGCIGELIKIFIGLITVLWRKIFRSGTVVNQITVEGKKIVCFLREATLMENGVIENALKQVPLLSASGQFRWD